MIQFRSARFLNYILRVNTHIGDKTWGALWRLLRLTSTKLPERTPSVAPHYFEGTENFSPTKPFENSWAQITTDLQSPDQTIQIAAFCKIVLPSCSL